MGRAGAVLVSAFVFLAVTCCDARHGMDHGQWAKEKSIMCYECNSAYDPRCADPFNDYTIGMVNCSKKRPFEVDLVKVKPTICRKTVQKVQNNLRVIRGCGYILDEERDDKACFRRTGTHDVIVFYCSCKGNLCNGSAKLSISLTALMSAAILVPMLLFADLVI